jgi:hypothetical protein
MPWRFITVDAAVTRGGRERAEITDRTRKIR